MRLSLYGLGIVLLACVATLSVNAQPTGTVQATTKWEYRAHLIKGNAANTEEANALGRQGWELVSAVSLPQDHGNVLMYFKRPLR